MGRKALNFESNVNYSLIEEYEEELKETYQEEEYLCELGFHVIRERAVSFTGMEEN
jgi:hypothetical protein